MLERVTACLETGRCLLRVPQRCPRGRRMLHSSFWHHGASDLPLPIWWASVATLERGPGDDAGEGKMAHRSDGPLLDFLYPEKTIAMFQHISYGLDALEIRRRQQFKTSSTRQFSTTRPRTGEDERDAFSSIYPQKGGTEGDFSYSTRSKTRRTAYNYHEPFAPARRKGNTSNVHDEEARAIERRNSELRETQLREEVSRKLQGSTPRDALHKLLESDDTEKQELAWRLYSLIQEPQRTSDLKTRLLEYLTTHAVSVESSRVLEIFDSLPLMDRHASSYRASISAYVALRMVGPAIQLLKEASANFSGLDCGTDALLARLVEDNNWELTLRVFETLLASRLPKYVPVHSFDYLREDLKPVWKFVVSLPNLSSHLLSLLKYVGQSHQVLQDKKELRETLWILMNGFVPEVIEQVLTPMEPNEDRILTFMLGLFRDLQTLDIPRASSYEFAIRRLLQLPRYRLYTNQRKVFQELYNMYRKECVQHPKLRPSRSMISSLIMQHGAFGSIDVVDSLVKDLHIFYKDQWCTHFPTLIYLIRFYAKHGLADQVHEYFAVAQSHFPELIDLHVVSSLLYVYAKRVDVQGTTTQFKRISEEFGLVPDAACWNILLLAHTKADDLDGALACFNSLLDSGVVPDIHTFGPLLDLSAARGDVEAFEALHSKAEQLKITVRHDVRARAGYVQACLQSGDIEGAEAVALGMIKSKQAGELVGSLTHTWNMLITHYALGGDIRNSRRLYRQMIENDIPLNSWTYAALMRSFVEVRQTNAAYKILRVTMPKHFMRVLAFHYALVITGFIREGQYEHAARAHQRMIDRDVRQTENSRQASLLAIGIAELRRLKHNGVTNPHERLIEVEEALRLILFESYESEQANDEPRFSRFIDSREHSVPDGYFGLLILLYSTRGAYEICKELFEAASTANAEKANYEPPIMLLTTIMEAHLKAKEYEEVAKCWELARTQAEKLVKTLQQIIDPRPPKEGVESLLDHSLKESTASARIATNRRRVLQRATRTYIRSLLEQNVPECIQKAQRTISQLLADGYVIDNLTWNEFIQMLARRGRIVDAFSSCEHYLMPGFPGWRSLKPYYIRRNVQGFFWMDTKSSDVGRGRIMPKYKTLVVLAAAYAQVKRDEINGVGYNPEIGKWAREVLEKISPLTVSAIETMPRTGDKLQTMFLGGM